MSTSQASGANTEQQLKQLAEQWAAAEQSADTGAIERTLAGERRAVVVNFSDRPARVPLAGSWEVEVSSARQGAGEPYTGAVAGSEAVLLTPRGLG